MNVGDVAETGAILNLRLSLFSRLLLTLVIQGSGIGWREIRRGIKFRWKEQLGSS